ncbi:MAG: hypothetical protein ABR600_03090 [Actinomycetota bacterium]
MRRAITLLAAATLTILMAASTANAANGDCRQIRGQDTPLDPTDDVSVCRQDTWIHQGGAKLGNIAGFGQGAFPSWNTTKPTQSAQQGAGSGYYANSLFHQSVAPNDPRASATFTGTYTGVLDTMAADLYAFVSPEQTVNLDMGLMVDGESVFQTNIVPVKLSSTSTQQLKVYHFVFTNMYTALENAGKANTPTTVHSITLALSGTYVANDNTLFVYDASEVPSGFIFNLEPAGFGPYAPLDLAPPE